MNKLLSTLALLVISSCILFAKPILIKNKYLIATLYDKAIGTVSSGTAAYQLIYYPDKEIEQANDSDYWIIKNTGGAEYTFQNAATLKYIKYDGTAIDRSALVLVDSQQADKSTSFTLELKMSDNLCYYLIRSVVNPTKIWNKRGQAQGTVYPVGVFAGTGASNECFLFYDSSGNPVIDDGKVPAVLPTAGRTLGAFGAYASTLTFNGKTPVVDTAKKEFYLSVPQNAMGTTQNMTVSFVLKNTAHKLYINNVQVTSGSSVSFKTISGTSTQTIEIRNGTTVVASGTIVFSCLPLVQIFSNTTIGNVYNLTRLAVTEPNKTDTAEVFLSDIKTRGAYSSGLPKKAYAIKLKSSDAETSFNYSFLGLRSDNNWILDAMYIDPARMRNRVSTDLWNEFSTRPYYAASEPAMVNGTRGNFVEVFLNDSYNGLYCMTEKVDRKQLKLKKLVYSADSTTVTQRGGLYKAGDWTIATLLGNGLINNFGGISAFDNKNSSWNGFEAKYPDMDDGEPINWQPLYNSIYASSYLTKDIDFNANIATYYDLPLFLDYYLFIELMLATDNQGKNMYLAVYDQTVSPKLSLAPWDMDGTWGIRWNGSTDVTGPNQNFDNFVITNEHAQNELFLRLKRLNFDEYNTKLKDRYKQLRSSYFTYNNLMARFQNYCSLFNISGAANRELKRWSIKDINYEMNYLSTWITARLNYLDNQYLGAIYNGVNTPAFGSGTIEFAPNPVTDRLTVRHIQAGEQVQLISLQGMVLMHSISDGSDISFDMSGYEPGIYFIKTANKTAKVIKL